MTVHRLKPVQGAVLYSKSGGYRETVVRSLPDLQSFISDVNDLTFVNLTSGGVVLGGRTVPDQSGIDLTNIAELYQSDRRFRIRNSSGTVKVASQKSLRILGLDLDIG
jgi:hypothetical protein